MEQDAQLHGGGNSYATQWRLYHPRLGRWTSLDPLMQQFPHMSPYAAFDNNPVFYTDPLGMAPVNPTGEGSASGSETGSDTSRETAMPSTNGSVLDVAGAEGNPEAASTAAPAQDPVDVERDFSFSFLFHFIAPETEKWNSQNNEITPATQQLAI